MVSAEDVLRSYVTVMESPPKDEVEDMQLFTQASFASSTSSNSLKCHVFKNTTHVHFVLNSLAQMELLLKTGHEELHRNTYIFAPKLVHLILLIPNLLWIYNIF